MKVFIKYMVSLRCKMLVKEVLGEMHIPHSTVELGMVELLGDITADQREELRDQLLSYGLELLDDKKSILVEKIKNAVTEMIHYSDSAPVENYSHFLSDKLGYSYMYLSNVFSEVKGITLQQYIIMHKVEKVKELLLYDELNLTEISYRLHYSSVAHLSNQFKKVTGLTPSYYKKMKQKRDNNLEDM